jgi:hypothetical protein
MSNYPVITKPTDPFAIDVLVSNSSFNGILSASDIDVQTALNTIDDHNHDGIYATVGDVASLSVELDVLETRVSGITGGLNQLDNTFVNVTGDTMTGTLFVPTIGSHINPVTEIHLNHCHLEPISANPPYEEGLIFYDGDKRVLKLYNDIPDVALDIGEENWVRIVNKTGSTISNGQVVYINGAQGNRPTVALADKNSPTTAESTIGMATHDIANNAEGLITTFGLVRNVNTNGYTNGDTLWVNTNGGYTNVKPSVPIHAVRVGYVVVAHATQGIILVSVDTGSDLGELHDVSITNVQNGDLLTYSQAISAWSNSSIVSATSGALDARYIKSNGTTTAGRVVLDIDPSYLTSLSDTAFTLKSTASGNATLLAFNNGSSNQFYVDKTSTAYRIASTGASISLNHGSDIGFFMANTKNIIIGASAFTGKTISTYGDIVSRDRILCNSDFVLPKTSGIGIKVDTTTPTFPWHDKEFIWIPDIAGGDAPNLATFRDDGGGLTVRSFAYNVGDRMDAFIHIPHDWVVGTDLYLHVHWAHNGTSVSGNMIWKANYTMAKGHNQQNFGAIKSQNITYNTVDITTTPQYRHRIDEVQLSDNGGTGNLLDTAQIEVDGIIMLSLIADTIPTIGGGTTSPFLITTDLHYQSSNIGTKNKAPNFYS